MIHSKYISQNLSDLEKLSKELAPLLNEGGVVTLNGQIGAGKTTLAKLIIQQLTQTLLKILLALHSIYTTLIIRIILRLHIMIFIELKVRWSSMK